jgi:predicted AlkP superfamily phosphohydrolase/phosphomutase
VPGPAKVVFLALDSTPPEVLRPWVADGTLPNLARLAGSGLEVPVEGPEGLEVGATWPTFYTAAPPGHHGVCWIDRVVPGTYRQQRMTPVDFAHLHPFWLQLGGAGRRVLVFDVPFAPLQPGLRGIQVNEWGSHEGVLGCHTAPHRIRRRILERWGAYPATLSCETPRLDDDGYRELTDNMIRGAGVRTDMTVAFMSEERWDLVTQVFAELHCACHLLWHFHDPSHPDADPASIARLGDLLREVCVAVDRGVGRIVDAAGPEAIIMVGSLHGMASSCGSSLLLPDMLEHLGALRRASRRSATTHGPRRERAHRGLGGLYHRLVPEAMRVALYEARQRVNTGMLHRGEPIDIVPEATRAFPIGFGAGSTFSGIRFNLVGREPAGTLAPSEVDRFIEELAAGLREFTDPDTGRCLVRQVLRTAERYPGPRSGDLPDLLVEWQHDPPRGSTQVGSGAGGVWRGISERSGLISHSNGSARTGSHRLPGTLFIAGPGVPAGRRLGRTVATVDLAPTMAGWLGVELSGVSGRPVPELLRDG